MSKLVNTQTSSLLTVLSASLLNTPQEPPMVIEKNRPPAHWPAKGEIHIENLTVKYAPHLPFALNGVDLHIKQGEKVGIVGRTGSGKTSMSRSVPITRMSSLMLSISACVELVTHYRPHCWNHYNRWRGYLQDWLTRLTRACSEWRYLKRGT